jgi:hypothetical protein
MNNTNKMLTHKKLYIMNTIQLKQKRCKLHVYLMMLVWFFLCGSLSSYAQQEIYKNGHGLVVGTSDSRLAATVIETETGVIMQVIAIGEMSFDALEFSFFLKQGKLVWSDKTFTKELPYDVPGSSKELFNENIDISEDLQKGGDLNLEFKIAGGRYREAGTAVSPNFSRWSDVAGMDVLSVSILDPNNYFEQSEGEIKLIFSCYLKKLGDTFQPTDIGMGTKTTFWGGKFCPKWTHGGVEIAYDNTRSTYTPLYMRPQQFSYRSSASVAINDASEISSAAAILKGSFKRGDILPVNNLLDGWEEAGFNPKDASARKLRHNGLLNWDQVLQSGFIYTNDASVALSIEEYTNTLLINGEKYLFPDAAEIAAGEFIRGNYTFYIVSKANFDASGSVDYSISLTGLTPNTTYLAWPYIGYAFETSGEYFKLGAPLQYMTGSSATGVPEYNHTNETISVYPNPLVSSQVVYVDANLDEGSLKNATIEIYNSVGLYIDKVNAQRLTPIHLPEEKGMYVLKFKSEEREENFKVIVK